MIHVLKVSKIIVVLSKSKRINLTCQMRHLFNTLSLVCKGYYGFTCMQISENRLTRKTYNKKIQVIDSPTPMPTVTICFSNLVVLGFSKLSLSLIGSAILGAIFYLVTHVGLSYFLEQRKMVVFRLILKHRTIVHVTETSSKIASKLSQKWLAICC